MPVRVTQQVTQVAYDTTAQARVTAIALEVIAPVAGGGGGGGGGGRKPIVMVIG